MKRRAALDGYQQAYFKSEEVFPTPFAQACSMRRSLNPKKTHLIGTFPVPKDWVAKKYFRRVALTEEKDIDLPCMPRLMKKSDVPQVYKLYKKQYPDYKIHFKYSQEELS